MLRLISYGLLLLCLHGTLFAQNTNTPVAQWPWLTHDSENQSAVTPPLPYPETRAADILWEKHIWREIDTRQKINLVFRAPNHNLFELIQNGLAAGALRAYRPSLGNEPFSEPFPADDIAAQYNQSDTIIVRNPETGEYYSQAVTNELNPDRVQRWRLQEVWYFDARYGQLKVRILGIAPILDSYGEDGEKLRYSLPMYWINYAEARSWLAQHTPFSAANDRPILSWDDLFQMRRFHGYVYRESDLLGRRLKDYAAGTDLLHKSRQIDEAILNREMDSWSY